MPATVSYPRSPKSGQIACYLNRTYHVLTTSGANSVASAHCFGYAWLPNFRGFEVCQRVVEIGIDSNRNRLAFAGLLFQVLAQVVRRKSGVRPVSAGLYGDRFPQTEAHCTRYVARSSA